MQSPDVFILCGGNAPGISEKEEDKASSRCVKVDVKSCNIATLPLSMTVARQDLRPVCTKGQCYLFGGSTLVTTDSAAAKSIDRLDITTLKVEKIPLAIAERRLAYAAAVLDDGRILATGGYGEKDATGKGPILQSAEILQKLCSV